MIFAFVTAVLFLAVIAVGIVLFVRAQVNKKKENGKTRRPCGAFPLARRGGRAFTDYASRLLPYRGGGRDRRR